MYVKMTPFAVVSRDSLERINGFIRVTVGLPYLLSAGVSFLLLAYVLAAGGSSIVRLQIMSVAAGTLAWSVWFGFLGPEPDARFRLGTLLAELLLLFGWYALLERLLRGPYLQSMPELVRRGVRWSWFVAVAVIIAAMLLVGSYGIVLPLEKLVSLAFLVLGLLGLVLAGQLYGEATIEPYATLRGFCFAAVAVIGAQFFMFAIALLLPETLSWLMPLRALAVLIALMLLFYSLYVVPQWSLAIFVSQQASVYAPRLLAAVAALLILVAGLPLMRSIELSTAQRVAPLYAAIVVMVLLLVLFSEPLRAQLRVFVSKHFLPFRYDYREEWLRLIDTLASPGQDRPLPERAIQALAQIVGSPAGVLWMRASDGAPFQCIESWNTNLKPDVTVSPNDPVVVFMRERQWILDTAELNRQPELYPGVTRPEWLASFPDGLLIVPLMSSETVIGFVILFQSSSAFRLTFEEIDLLRTSGRQVAAHLAQYHADRQLSEARQFEAFNRLTAFVMHDLKNLIAQQSLMVKNAAKHKGNPAFFEDAMATIENSVARMNKLLQQLQTGDASGPARLVSLHSCVREALKKCAGRLPEPQLSESSEATQVFADGEHLTNVLAHLVRNAQDAVSGDGGVRVKTGLAGTKATITIADDGCGMEEEFIRHRLFRPFDTTKGSKGMGVGAYQARAFILASGGTMNVDSEPGVGTTITIQLPSHAPAEVTPE
jgi:putative PEP-CTERM system histidine kinase